jgi:hypothetical protein
MNGKRLDLVGQRFGRLMVTKFNSVNKFGGSIWECLCDCGDRTVVFVGSLRSGNTLSCGCLRKEKIAFQCIVHGHASGGHSPTYMSWINMKNRCLNKNTERYGRYGGRGIKCCEEWLDFANFIKDMGEKPIGKTLDRIDNNGNYEPANCRWATSEEQQNNTGSNRFLTLHGETKTVAEWSRHLCLKPYNIHNRLRYGWTVEDALLTPVGMKRNGENVA